MVIRLFCILLATSLGAQTPTNPVHSTATIYCPVIADASYSIKRMNVNFTQLGGLNTSQDSQNIANIVSSTLTGYGVLDKSYTFLSKGIFELSISSFAAAQAVSGALSQIIGSFASQNTQYRFFVFYLPVSAPYSISVSMPGDPIIRPNNKVQLYSGSFGWTWSDELSRDTTNTFNFNNLDAGPYILVVGLGSTSSWFHSAGNLTQVQLNSQNYQTWMSKAIVGVATYNGNTLIPNIGNTAQVSFQYLPVPNNGNIIDGNVTYSNYSPHYIYESYTYNDAWTWKSGAGRWVEFPNFTSTSSSVNGPTAFFTIRRDQSDYEWITQ